MATPDAPNKQEMTDMEPRVIGKITATERKPTSFNSLRFWLADEQEIRIFDVIRIKHIKDSYTYAIVKDLQHITDSAGHLASFVSSDFGDVASQPINPRMGTTIAEADVLYNSKNIEMPVRDGALVETADIDGVRTALGLVGFQRPIPAGYISMSYGVEVPIEFESSYILGPEGAHLNIAGISGLATKTSYAMFLLNSIQQRMGEDASMVLFNVKKNDLLAIDEEPLQALSQRQIDEWSKCGLEPRPFQSVRYLYPYSERRQANGYSNTSAPRHILEKQQHEGRAHNFFYDVSTMKFLLLKAHFHTFARRETFGFGAA